MTAKDRNQSERQTFLGMGRGDALVAGKATAPDQTHMDMSAFITPEMQILNVALSLQNAVHGGRRSGRADEITSTTDQLVSMLETYFAGQLKPAPKSDCPF